MKGLVKGPEKFFKQYEVIPFILSKILELRELEEIEKTKRIAIQKDIELIRKAYEKEREVFRRIVDKKIEDRKQILKNLLRFINLNLQNPEVLSVLLDVYVELMKKPVVSEEDISNLTKISAKKLINSKSLLEKNIIEL